MSAINTVLEIQTSLCVFYGSWIIDEGVFVKCDNVMHFVSGLHKHEEIRFPTDNGGQGILLIL